MVGADTSDESWIKRPHHDPHRDARYAGDVTWLGEVVPGKWVRTKPGEPLWWTRPEQVEILRALSVGGGHLSAASVPLRHENPFGPKRGRKPGLAKSKSLSGKQVRVLYEGVAAANLLGSRLDFLLTLTWGASRLDGEDAWTVDREFRNLLVQHMAGQGLARRWIWTRENRGPLGDHSHILMAAPDHHRRQILAWANKALKTVTGFPPEVKQKYDRSGVQSIHGGPMKAPRTVDDQWRMFRYLAKGLDPHDLEGVVGDAHAKMLVSEAANIHPQRQGVVVGKRSGVSESLNNKAIALRAQDNSYFDPRMYVQRTAWVYDNRFEAAGVCLADNRDWNPMAELRSLRI